MTADSPAARAELQARLLACLQEHPGQSAYEIAARLRVRTVLRVLEEAGQLVSSESPNRVGGRGPVTRWRPA